MRAQVIVFSVVSAFFGLIVGWIIGSQQTVLSRSAAPAPVAQGTQQTMAAQPKPLDEGLVTQLRGDIQREPSNVKARVDLGNLYYDSDRFEEAAKWYEEAMKLDPNNINVSTDLGVSYWNINQPDRALQQFAHSLTIDPKHATTLLNRGIVLAFGKQDLEGAAASWQKVIDLAPDSQEGQKAKRLLDGVKSAHPELGGKSPGASEPRS